MASIIEKKIELNKLFRQECIDVEGYKVGPFEEMIWIRICDSDVVGKQKAGEITESAIEQFIDKILKITEV